MTSEDAQRASGHDCSTCEDCIHDGRKCCGCYDGACCRVGISEKERARLDDIIHHRPFTADSARLDAVMDAVEGIYAARPRRVVRSDWLAGFRAHRDGDTLCPHGYGKGDHHWESGDCLAGEQTRGPA